MTSATNTMDKGRYLARLLKCASGLRAESDIPGSDVVASYWTPNNTRSFAFSRNGLLIDPDGQARFIAFADIEDSGYHDREQLMAAKTAIRAGETLIEKLSLQLVGGEQIDLALNPRSDRFSEKLMIGGLIDRHARINRVTT